MGTPPRGATRHGVEATPPAPGRQARALQACPEQGVPRPSPALPGGTARDTTTASSGGVGWACLNHGPAPRPGHHAFPTGVTGFAPEAHVSGQGRQAASSGFICDHDRPPVPVMGPPGWTTARGQTPRPELRRSLAVCRRRAQWSRHDKGAAAGRRMPALQGLAFRKKRKGDAGRALNRKQRTQGFVIN